MLTAPPLIGRSHPGINFSRLEIAGDLGGFVAVAGVVVTLLIGLPAARAFFAGAVAGGTIVAVCLRAWLRRHPAPSPPHVDGRWSRPDGAAGPARA